MRSENLTDRFEYLACAEVGEFARGLYNSVENGTPKRMLRILGEVPRVRTALLPPFLDATDAAVERAKMSLLETGCVTEGVDSAGTYLSVHPQLAEYLVELSGPCRESTPTLRRAHALAEANHTPAASIAQLLELGELEAAQKTALEHFSAVLEERRQTLRALRGVSLEQLENYPTLLMCRLILERPDGTIPISTVEQMARGLHMSLLEQRLMLGDLEYSRRLPMQIATERMLGMWDSALQLSHQLLQFTRQPEGAAFVGEEKLSPIAFAVVSLTGILGGDLEMAEEASETGYRLAVLQENTLEQVHALSLAALNLALRGQVVEALEKLQLAEHLSTTTALNPPEFSWVDGVLATALVAYYRADGEGAQVALDRLSTDMERMEQWPIVVLVESLVTRMQVGADEALELMRRRRGNVPEGRAVSQVWNRVLQARHADLATYAGRYLEAQHILDAIGDATAGPNLKTLSQVRLLLFRGNYRDVVRLVDSLEHAETPSLIWEGLQTCGAAAKWALGGKEGSTKTLLRIVGAQGTQKMAHLISGIPFPLAAQMLTGSGEARFVEVADALPETLKAVQYGELSNAEMDVLRALAKGDTMAETAAGLYISENTLKTHRRSIYQTLHVGSRAQALTVAMRRGLL